MGALNFEEMKNVMNRELENEALIKENIERTSYALSTQEKSHNCDVSVTDFILENYKDVRLFFSPDHPTKFLYDFVVREIARRADLPVRDSYYSSGLEPQPEIKIPIPAELKATMGLSFADADFSAPIAGRALNIPYDEYQKLLFGQLSGAKTYRCINKTKIKSAHDELFELGRDEEIEIKVGEMVQIAPGGSSYVDNGSQMSGAVLFSTLGEREIPDKIGSNAYIYGADWEDVT